MTQSTFYFRSKLPPTLLLSNSVKLLDKTKSESENRAGRSQVDVIHTSTPFFLFFCVRSVDPFWNAVGPLFRPRLLGITPLRVRRWRRDPWLLLLITTSHNNCALSVYPPIVKDIKRTRWQWELWPLTSREVCFDQNSSQCWTTSTTAPSQGETLHHWSVIHQSSAEINTGGGVTKLSVYSGSYMSKNIHF